MVCLDRDGCGLTIRDPFKELNHEFYIQTQSNSPRTNPWFPCPDGYALRPSRYQAPSRQGSQAPQRLRPFYRGLVSLHFLRMIGFVQRPILLA